MADAHVTSATLTAKASALRDLATHFDTRAGFFADDVDSADNFVASVRDAWNGPRADDDVASISEYVDKIRGMHDAIIDVAATVRAFADDAEQISEWMAAHETALAEARDATPAGDTLPQEAWYEQRAIDSLRTDWIVTCRTHSGTIEAACEPLETAHGAYVSGFSNPVVTGDDYVNMLVHLGIRNGADLTTLGLKADEIRVGIEHEAGSDVPADVMQRLIGDPAALLYWSLLTRDQQTAAIAANPVLMFLDQWTRDDVFDDVGIATTNGSGPRFDENGELYELVAQSDLDNVWLAPPSSGRYRFSESYTIVPPVSS